MPGVSAISETNLLTPSTSETCPSRFIIGAPAEELSAKGSVIGMGAAEAVSQIKPFAEASRIVFSASTEPQDDM